MNTHASKASENKSQAALNVALQKKEGAEPTFQLVDNRPKAVAQRKLQEMANNSHKVKQLKAIQEMANNSHIVKEKNVAQRSGNSKSVHNVIQRKTLKIDKSFVNTPANRDSDKLGLGEDLTLTSTATGPDKEGEGTGTALYKKESGSGELNGDTYTANGTAGNVEFSVKRDDEGDELKDKLSIGVIEPTGGKFLNVSSENSGYSDDMAGAGFIAENTEYLPDTVSFNGLLVREGEALPETSGPFKKWATFKHDEGDWESLDEKNKLNLDDDIQSGGISKDEFDDVDNGGPGNFKWNIPWDYKVPGKGVKSFNVIHEAKISDSGKVSMEKLNGKEERDVPDGPW